MSIVHNCNDYLIKNETTGKMYCGVCGNEAPPQGPLPEPEAVVPPISESL
jgi:hypothetical protein